MPLFGWGAGRTLPLRPDQQLNADEAEQDKIDHIVAREDARYDAMTDEQREKYYIKPSMLTRLKKYLRKS
jgi:hypothetical protein